jgi:hypothetical protein
LNPGLSPHKILSKTLASINFDLDNESILRPLAKKFATLNSPSVSIRTQIFKHALVLKPCKQKNAINPNPKTMPQLTQAFKPTQNSVLTCKKARI